MLIYKQNLKFTNSSSHFDKKSESSSFKWKSQWAFPLAFFLVFIPDQPETP
jgi:hypothetical protein